MFERNGRPVIFGEVLFDTFEDGSLVMGGAPFNVAWHLQGFGLRPLLISRVGQDEQGELVLLRMQQWGMDTQAIQIDPVYPTGRVSVTIQDNEPHYEIAADQAYDKISAALVIDKVTDLPCSQLYCGSLVQRDPISRKTLQRLMLEQQLPIFVDINRRPPWINEENIGKTLQAATCVKMNEDELAMQSGLMLQDENSLRQAAEMMQAKYSVKHVYITRGEKGACYFGEAGAQFMIAHQLNAFIDSVGAGDAFAAVCLLGQIQQWPVAVTLARANIFASLLCEQQGALIEEPSVYTSLSQDWA